MNPIFPKVPNSGIIKTPNLTLEPPSREQFEEIFQSFEENYPHIKEHLPDTPYDLPTTLGWIDDQTFYAQKQERYSWIAKDNTTKKIVGYIGVYQIEPHRKANPSSAQLRYWVDKDHKRKGIGSEMVETISQALSPTKLNLHILQSNKPSQRLAEKLGGNWIEQLDNDGCYVNIYEIQGQTGPSN